MLQQRYKTNKNQNELLKATCEWFDAFFVPFAEVGRLGWVVLNAFCLVGLATFDFGLILRHSCVDRSWWRVHFIICILDTTALSTFMIRISYLYISPIFHTSGTTLHDLFLFQQPSCHLHRYHAKQHDGLLTAVSQSHEAKTVIVSCRSSWFKSPISRNVLI
jgi:hypothetical protein